MRARHLGHRSEIRSGADGLGRHFDINLKDDTIFEENIMRHFELTIIASVEPGQPWTQKKLDDLEGKFQHNLMTMDCHGGINIRDENKRKNGNLILYWKLNTLLHCS